LLMSPHYPQLTTEMSSALLIEVASSLQTASLSKAQLTYCRQNKNRTRMCGRVCGSHNFASERPGLSL
jgi:hypothetical protein